MLNAVGQLLILVQGSMNVYPTNLQLSVGQQSTVGWTKNGVRYGVSENTELTTKGVSLCIAVAVVTVLAGLINIPPIASA
jgi:hypothetical protein